MTAKKNKFLLLFVTLSLLFCVFGCQKAQSGKEPIRVVVTVGAFEDGKSADSYDFFLSDEIEYNGGTAGNYFRALCNKNDVLIKGVDDGYITEISEYKNNDTNAWMFYCEKDGSFILSPVGVLEVVPSPGETIVLSYIDWTKLFAKKAEPNFGSAFVYPFSTVVALSLSPLPLAGRHSVAELKLAQKIGKRGKSGGKAGFGCRNINGLQKSFGITEFYFRKILLISFAGRLMKALA